MTPVLHSRGFLLLGPTKQLFVSKCEHIESEVLELISEENIDLPEGKVPVERVDIRVIELFNKDWCGMLDLSEEGVASLEDWDTAFAKLQQTKQLA